MKRVYVIAKDETVFTADHKPALYPTVLHSFGVWFDEANAQLKCTEMNAEAIGDDDDPEIWEDIYYVISLHVRDSK